MRMFRSEDPALDAERYMMVQDILLARRPQCHCCEKHIPDEAALHYSTMEIDIWLCQECIENNTEYIEVD